MNSPRTRHSQESRSIAKNTRPLRGRFPALNSPAPLPPLHQKENC
jgi:hypothetical protein